MLVDAELFREKRRKLEKKEKAERVNGNFVVHKDCPRKL
jgi:hypothetical protein